MGRCPDLSAVLAGLYDKPLLGPKPDQLLVFKRPQLAVKLESLMQAANSAAAKHMNNSLVNQAIAAMYQHPQLHDHVVGWAPVRSGQLNTEVHLSFKDASAQHRQQLASTAAIQVTMPGAAAPVSLPVSTVAAKQLPEVTVSSLSMGVMSLDIAAVTPAWCRSDVCIAELRAPVQDAKLCQLLDAFTCFGQRVSVSVQPSLLAKAHLYRQRVQTQPPAQQQTISQSPRQRRRQQKKARAKKAASQPSGQHQQQLQSLQTTFCLAVSADEDVESRGRVALTRPLDPVSDLGGQQGRAGLGHSAPEPMLLEPSRPAADQVGSPVSVTPMEVAAAVIAPPCASAPALSSAPTPASASTTASASASASALAPALEPKDADMPQASPAPVPLHFPDGAVASAMLLWAEDIDVPLDTARQAVQHVHAEHIAQITQHGTASHVALAEPLQSLMIEAIRVVTGNASFHPFPDTQAAGSISEPQHPNPEPLSASESAPRRSSRARNPVSPYWKVPPAAPGGAQ
ncbi:TPA: hypothetical protein ACH3X1_005406 [Trebouxia sp. C0004]